MAKRQQVQKWLIYPAAGGILLAQVGSMSHLVSGYSWAYSAPMALALGVVTVILSGAFLGLSIVTPESRARKACLGGMVLLGTIETAVNLTIGWLLVTQSMPARVADLFGLDLGATQRLAAFALSGAVPILVFIGIFALGEIGKEYWRTPPIDLRAEQRLRMHEDSSELREPAGVAADGSSARRGG